MGLPSKILKRLCPSMPEKYQWLGSAILGIITFLVMTLAVWMIIALSRAEAAEITQDGWLVAGETYLLLEQAQNDRTSFCRESRKDLTSNLGADMTLYKRGVIEWHAHAVHHSCAFGPDTPEYNAAGMGVVFRFVR